MEGNVQQVVKQVSKFDGKNADDFLKWYSKLRISLSLYSKFIFKIVQGSQRPPNLDNDQATARTVRDDASHNLYGTLYFTTSGQAFSVVRRFKGKTGKDGKEHRKDTSAGLREKFDGYSCEAFWAAYREMETVKMRSNEGPDDFLPPKDRYRDRLNLVTPKEGGKCGAHTTRPPSTAKSNAAPGRQTDPTAAFTSPKSVLRVFLASVARGIFLCEMTSTKSPAFHFRRERSSIQPIPP